MLPNGLQRWKVKAAVQGLSALVPRGYLLNRFFQRYVTRGLILTAARFQIKIEIFKRHLDNFRRARGQHSGFEVLELGTGRFPIIPVGFFLCGARRTVSIDLFPLLAHGPFRRSLQMIADYAGAGQLREAQPERLEKLRSVLKQSEGASCKEILQQLDIECIVGDARRTSLPAASFDLLVSNNTLEHVTQEVIVDIFREFRRLVRPHGLMSHFIDMRDHYAEFDGSINVFNYLKYSDRAWRMYNNSVHYQNRLRVSDYRRFHESAGWRTISQEDELGSATDLRRTNLAEKFRRYSEAELLVCTSWIISEPASENPGW